MGLEFYTSGYSKSRKTYKCDLCGGPIIKGTEYYHFSGKYDGSFIRYRHHRECQDIVDSYTSDYCDDEFCHDDIAEWWRITRCEKCTHSRECDRDMDRGCWCTMFDAMQ